MFYFLLCSFQLETASICICLFLKLKALKALKTICRSNVPWLFFGSYQPSVHIKTLIIAEVQIIIIIAVLFGDFYLCIYLFVLFFWWCYIIILFFPCCMSRKMSDGSWTDDLQLWFWMHVSFPLSWMLLFDYTWQVFFCFFFLECGQQIQSFLTKMPLFLCPAVHIFLYSLFSLSAGTL